jgi:hypothetical protein
VWLMILIAVHLNDPKDIPARVQMEFETQQACERAKSSLAYWVKFESFKVVAECKKQF